MNFNVVITSSDAVRIVGQLGQVLGPHDLIPNPKVGIVTSSVAEAAKNAKVSQVCYRNDKSGIIHTTTGKMDSDTDELKENLEALLTALKKAEPIQAEGVYIKKVSISTTMGAGVTVDQAGLSASANQYLYAGGGSAYSLTSTILPIRQTLCELLELQQGNNRANHWECS